MREELVARVSFGTGVEVEDDTEIRAVLRVALGAVFGVDPPVGGGIQLGFGLGVPSHIRSGSQLDAYYRGQLGCLLLAGVLDAAPPSRSLGLGALRQTRP